MNDAPVPGRTRLLALLLLFLVLWFGVLDYRTLIKSDEGRYAEISREMTVTGDWVTPRYNSVKYFEKPPLQYWATAAAFKAFGEHEWTARLWVALTGCLSVLMVFFAGQALFGTRAGLLGSIAQASMMLPAFAGHFNTLDMGVGAFMCAALFALMLAQRDSASQAQERGWMLVCYAMMALALLSKGLIGILLPGAVLFVYLLVTRDFARLKHLHIIKGTLLFLLISVPWFYLVIRANPEFFQFFFIHEHFERFFTKVHARYQPAWYFIPLLIAGALPWTLYLVPALLQGLTGDRSSLRFGGGHGERSGKGLKPWRPQLLLMLWVVVIFVFFSASSSKLAGYIVPIFPALAMLIGLAIQRTSRTMWLWTAVSVLILAIAGFVGAFRMPELADTPQAVVAYLQYQKWVQAGMVIMAVCAGLAMWLRSNNRFSSNAAPLRAVLVLAFGAYAATQCVMLGHESLRDQGASSYTLAKAIDAAQKAANPGGDYKLYMVNDLDHTLPFYLKKTGSLVIDRDELNFGLKYSPERYFPDIKSFAKQWRADPQAAAVMYIKTLDDLKAEGLSYREVGRDSIRVAIIKTSP